MAMSKRLNRPLLRYHGGKWRIAPWIISNLPKHQNYVEPFCGAASILLRKPKSGCEVLNDLNGRLINVFKVLRDPESANVLKDQISKTPCSLSEYHAARVISDDRIEDARRMIILGHQSRGSTACSGGKLTGWRRGIRKQRNRSSADEWSDIHKYVDSWSDRLRGVFLESQDAFQVIDQWDKLETLFYVDPPYVASTRHGSGNKGYSYELTNCQHIDLSEKLHNIKGRVVLSGYNSEMYESLYSGWNKIERSSLADAGKKTIECLWISPQS